MRTQQPKPRPDLGAGTGTRHRVASVLITSMSLIAVGLISLWLLLVGIGGIGFVEQIVPWPLPVLGVLVSIAFVLTVSLLRRKDGRDHG